MIALSAEDRRDLVRWLVCGVLVMFAHAAIAAVLIEWREPVEDVGEVGNDAIYVELMPEVLLTEPTPQPVEKIEKPDPLPEQPSEAVLPPEPKADPEPPREQIVIQEKVEQRATASVATWQSEVVTILEHNKCYPTEASARGEHGTSLVAFSIDRDGHLLSSRIVKSSGYAALDAEALALVKRAQPYPAPPPDRVGFELSFPYYFNIR
jgi:protein TonB